MVQIQGYTEFNLVKISYWSLKCNSQSLDHFLFIDVDFLNLKIYRKHKYNIFFIIILF